MGQQILTLLEQILIMFLLMATGYAVFRLGILNNDATRQISALLAKVVAPAVIVGSFQRSFDPALGRTLLVTFALAFGTLGVGVLVGHLLYRPARFPENYVNRRLCVIFSNNGFMALPLLQAMYGATGVFLGSAHIVASNTLMWTYGVRTLSGARDRFDLRKVFWNPGAVALMAGVLLFLSPYKLPDPLFAALQYVGSLNTPLAMLLLGCFLAQTDLPAVLRDFGLYRASLARLLVVPALCIPLLLLVPLAEDARMILLIGYATPVAVLCATFSQIYQSDYLYCTRLVALSTLLSAVTMPLMIALYQGARGFFP